MARDLTVMSMDVAWLRSLGFTAALVLLVAFATGDSLESETATVILATLASAGFFLWLYRGGSRFFVISFANGIAVYTCAFSFIVQSNFVSAGSVARSAAFLIPLMAFVIGVWWRRERISEILSGTPMPSRRQFTRVSSWLIPVSITSALTFLVPSLALTQVEIDIALVASMVLVAVFIFFVSTDICIFLVDTGVLFDGLLVRLTELAAPAFAFLTLYSLTVIVFACIYRIVGLLSATPHFIVGGMAREMTFSEALYFSLVTISTVGYGEITPATDFVRLVVSLEIVSGVLLLVFGLYEIMNFARSVEERRARREHGHHGE